MMKVTNRMPQFIALGVTVFVLFAQAGAESKRADITIGDLKKTPVKKTAQTVEQAGR